MRDVGLAGAELGGGEQAGGHHGVGQRDRGRHAKAAADVDGLAVHEAEISQHGPDQRKGGRLLEIPFDDEDLIAPRMRPPRMEPPPITSRP